MPTTKFPTENTVFYFFLNIYIEKKKKKKERFLDEKYLFKFFIIRWVNLK